MNDGESVGFEELIGLWEEGARRLSQFRGDERAAIERVIAAVVLELRRRVGGTFTTDELATYYLEQGTDWCFDLAVRVAPSTPEAWDITVVAGAAFARRAGFASDFGGGRRTPTES